MARQTSSKGKGTYAVYKTENKVFKNKIKKLERHCKRFPEDEVSKENLQRIKKDGYTGRARPLVPGSNPTEPKVRLPAISHVKTPGEQLSELLGIPLPKYARRYFKKGSASVTIKNKKKYVKA